MNASLAILLDENTRPKPAHAPRRCLKGSARRLSQSKAAWNAGEPVVM
jgi:hypothetical protein